MIHTHIQNQINRDLPTQAWTVLDDVFDLSVLQQLALECETSQQQGQMKNAAVGRGDGRQIDKTTRGDQIQWLETGMSVAIDTYLNHIESLRQFLNQQFFLGLDHCENHFAFYPPGAFYQKHVDRFRSDDARTVSTVLYLNSDWRPENGGQLRLHLDGGLVDIEPIANRLILFMSDSVWHEVLPTTAVRKSITGWYRRKENTLR